MNSVDKLLNKYVNNENRNSNYQGYTLESIIELLKKCGNPHENLSCIHIAGTNGKGSTAAFLNNIYSNQNYKTGLYTSPHLLNVNERIVINNEPISDHNLFRILNHLDTIIIRNNISITYFDLLTAAAFVYFNENNCDIIILETGLGGRNDSTNVCNSMLSIITDISKDHTSILGSSLEEISFEKAGIIKKDSITITSNENEIVLNVLKSEAKNKNSNFHLINKSNVKNNSKYKSDNIFSIIHPIINLNNIKLNYFPPFQIINLSLALLAVSLLNENFPIDIKHSLKFIENFSFPGRFELLNNQPIILFDAAHNLHSMMMLKDSIKYRYTNQKIRVFLSIMGDKNPLELVDFIEKNISNDITYIYLNNYRCYKPDKDFKYKSIDEFNISEINNLISKENVNLFTGSFRLYPLVKDLVKELLN